MAKNNKSAGVQIKEFNFAIGRILAGKYEILAKLGAGWEGEVYLIRETTTGIERTAKFFFPQRNIRDKASKFYATKLHKLRHCPMVIQYYGHDMIMFKRAPIKFLISEFVEGELLSQFLKRQPGKRLLPFQAVHLLHSLAMGMECIHRKGDYHGDLHTDNIIVQRYGLIFDLKLIDFIHWKATKTENIQDDVVDMIHIFYDSLGGKRHYPNQPKEVKQIICGLKRSLILGKFRSAGKLREYIETMQWN